MKRLPQVTSLLAVVALSVSLAYWAMQLFKAPQRPINPPAVPVVQDASVEAGASLFGGQVSVATASNYQLKGVVAAGNGAAAWPSSRLMASLPWPCRKAPRWCPA